MCSGLYAKSHVTLRWTPPWALLAQKSQTRGMPEALVPRLSSEFIQSAGRMALAHYSPTRIAPYFILYHPLVQSRPSPIYSKLIMGNMLPGPGVHITPPRWPHSAKSKYVSSDSPRNIFIRYRPTQNTVNEGLPVSLGFCCSVQSAEGIFDNRNLMTFQYAIWFQYYQSGTVNHQWFFFTVRDGQQVLNLRGFGHNLWGSVFFFFKQRTSNHTQQSCHTWYDKRKIKANFRLLFFFSFRAGGGDKGHITAFIGRGGQKQSDFSAHSGEKI